MSKNKKIIVILGPTASGKSELAVKIARKINGEIISADSRQIYKGLDIGTGKVYRDINLKHEIRSTKQIQNSKFKIHKPYFHKKIPHYCIDYVSPRKRYTVVDFKKCAEKTIKDILSRGKIPIICGGTGFYISAITGGIEIPEVKPNWKLRKKLGKIPAEKLFEMLKKVDPQRAKTIDAKNPRRLIRAIEIVKKLGEEIPSLRVTRNAYRGILFIGIKLPDKELKKKIEKRVKKMIRDGLLNEVKKLRNPPTGGGLSWKRLCELGFEYKYPALFLQNKISKKEMLERMLLENWHYAKRQMTWFKKYQPKIKWIKNYQQAEKFILTKKSDRIKY